MTDILKIKEHMDVISSDRKMVGKGDHLDGADKIKDEAEFAGRSASSPHSALLGRPRRSARASQ